MIRNMKIALALAALAFLVGSLAPVYAQDSMKPESKAMNAAGPQGASECGR